jgi:hypothetical protein
MKFYLMWANHDANGLWDKVISDTPAGKTTIWRGGIDRSEFRKMYKRMVDKYFHLDNYYKIDGCPVFMLYDLSFFLEGMGGVEEAAAALEEFREYVKSKGFPGVHIQITLRGGNMVNLSGVDGGCIRENVHNILSKVKFDSATHYQFCHFINIDRDFNTVMEDVKREWVKIEKEYDIPYFCHVSCGWDNNPRFNKFRPGILTDNTPANFENGLRAAKAYADAHPELPPLITINSWNEWTESSYLEPDDLYGYGYLDAIKRVFVDEE